MSIAGKKNIFLREAPSSHPVNSAKFGTFSTSDLGQMGMKKKIVLIYAEQCRKNLPKNCNDHNV